MRKINILALSGSTRSGSSNTALLNAAVLLVPENVVLTVWNAQAQLPHFSPDMETAPPLQVVEFRNLVGEVDGLLFACPEYARGLPGSFKNALDWLVGGETFVNKKFGQWNASPRAFEAQRSLRMVLETMSGQCVEEAYLELPLIKLAVTSTDIAVHPQWAAKIRSTLKHLIDAIEVESNFTTS